MAGILIHSEIPKPSIASISAIGRLARVRHSKVFEEFLIAEAARLAAQPRPRSSISSIPTQPR